MRPEPAFTPIDFASWPRRETFYYFSKMAPTGYSLTVDLDATALHRTLKAAYLEDKARHGDHHGILGKAGETPPPNAYTVSCLPWVSFRHFAVHSYERQPYLLPSVEAGKLRQEGKELLLPLSLTVHHAAADGWQVQEFLRSLQQEMDRFGDFL